MAPADAPIMGEQTAEVKAMAKSMSEDFAHEAGFLVDTLLNCYENYAVKLIQPWDEMIFITWPVDLSEKELALPRGKLFYSQQIKQDCISLGYIYQKNYITKGHEYCLYFYAASESAPKNMTDANVQTSFPGDCYEYVMQPREGDDAQLWEKVGSKFKDIAVKGKPTFIISSVCESINFPSILFYEYYLYNAKVHQSAESIHQDNCEYTSCAEMVGENIDSWVKWI
jgi:hypothetical protein